MNQFVFKIADRIYQYIFGYPMGERAKKFFENLGVVGLGLGVTTITSFGLMILAGRWMGPTEYGKANLVFSTATLLVSFLSFGLPTALVKFLASEHNQKNISATVFYVFFFLIFPVSLIFYLSRGWLEQLLHIKQEYLFFAIVYALVLAIADFPQSIFRALGRYEKLVLFHIASTLAFSFVLIFMFITKELRTTFQILIFASIFRLFVPLLFSFFSTRSFFNPFRIDTRWITPILGSGFFISLSTIPGLSLVHIDRLFLNYFLDPMAVGLYSAYVMASTFLVGKGVDMFLTVFFPYSSTVSNKFLVFEKLRTFWYFAIIPLIVLFFLFSVLAFTVFGKAYQFNAFLALFFSINSVLYAIGSIYVWLIFSMGGRALRYISFFIWIGAMANIALNVLLIPQIGLYAPPVATFVSYSFLILVSSRYFFSRYQPSPQHGIPI